MRFRFIVHDDVKRLAYEARTNILMLMLAFAYIVVYSVQVIPDRVNTDITAALETVNLFIWAVFILDLAIRLYFAERKLHFLATHPVDVVAVLVPALRPIRALRVFTASRGLMNSSKYVANTGIAVLMGAVVLIYIGALAILDVERHAAGSMITDFGDAIWWAIVTVTTVGYGDITPVTTDGRFVAGGLMIVGISVLGAVSATVAGWLVAGTEDQDDRNRQATKAEMQELRDHLEEAHAKLDIALAALGQARPAADEAPEPSSTEDSPGASPA